MSIDTISPEEWAVRRELAVDCRMFAHWGWDDLIHTHLWARVPEPEHHFLLNPFGLGFDEVTAANLVEVDEDEESVTPAWPMIVRRAHRLSPDLNG